ncbi:MAG: hypothetical protein U1F43_18155 [Myxococcota bacterium]
MKRLMFVVVVTAIAAACRKSRAPNEGWNEPPTIAGRRAALERSSGSAGQADLELRMQPELEPDAELRMTYLRRAIQSDGTQRDRLSAFIGERMRRDPDPKIRAEARRYLCGDARPLDEQALTCIERPGGCAALARCLPWAGPRAAGLVRPWIDRGDPALAQLAVDVVCARVDPDPPRQLATGLGPYLREALAIMAPGHGIHAPVGCWESLARSAGVELEDLDLQHCGERR